ncbi:aminotransferase class I/II-fold pyridoxal phosphate-dependent enzyme [Oceanobacillus halophilus]|uniref:Aminotransferase class I/II-fold pyridoxal phosphate-dependent enzyme n=1 Tax=Oceanobacillus halophilus TaxID=930130 RepID=A0A494ZXD1_9BACI|nr:aminotransferase class I/II-fold pyridoxal phosphate-dependent enzyme [Oceanobacillus halophilus]RKQ31360.1 aminotransferase class I/II-fold pyridoxal phosphate-dependent enzyme [Oceanobacillus halophilus]
MVLYVSRKVKNLPAYLFSEFQRKKKELQAKGVDVIDLGIGAPDLPTPNFIYQKLVEEAKKPENHKYSPYSGCNEFREAVADFYQRHYAVSLNPETEVLTLIGTKEGIANLVQSVINPGDKVLVPDPGYPVYRSAVHLAGGKSISLPLDEIDGTPLLERIQKKDVKSAKLMFLNYPCNPTTATVNLATYKRAVSFAKRNSIAIANDAAYDLLTFDGYKAPSIMQVADAKKHAVEFGTLSKSFSMAGWRIGYVVGNKEMIQSLATLKSNIDTSQFLAIQKAAAHALQSDFVTVKENNQIYKERIDFFHAALLKLGIYAQKPKGTFFIWAKVPASYTSMEFADLLLNKAGIIVTPGSAFGQRGEGFVRIALTVPVARLEEVIRRWKELKLNEVNSS